MVTVTVLVNTGFTFNINVAIESQPATLVKVSLYVPAVLYVLPCQVYGNWLLHIVMVSALVSIELTFNVSVTTESQPATLFSVTV